MAGLYHVTRPIKFVAGLYYVTRPLKNNHIDIYDGTVSHVHGAMVQFRLVFCGVKSHLVRMERYSDLYDEGSGLELVHVAEVLDYLGEYFVLSFSIEDIRWTNRSY